MSAAPANAGRAQAQRERILEAAHKCFGERGFHAASMASIADNLDHPWFQERRELWMATCTQCHAPSFADSSWLAVTGRPVRLRISSRAMNSWPGLRVEK